MPADTYPNAISPPPASAIFNAISRIVGDVTKTSSYIVIFVLYCGIFVVALATLALIEIRQANLKDFNALIAMLEEKDRYNSDYFKQALTKIDADAAGYEKHIVYRRDPPCPDHASANSRDNNNRATATTGNAGGSAQLQETVPENCDELRGIVSRHYIGLLWSREELLFKEANLPTYYAEYTDGLRQKTPQLIPLLQFMDTRVPLITEWARSPFEFLEMLLLVFMGALGGVISVTRCFVVPNSANPTVRDLCYRPAAGGVIALGIYVLFRAMQVFFGGVSEDSATIVSTSVFLLAALGLASGFCAREAVGQIEDAARKLLQRWGGNRNAGELPIDQQHPATIIDRNNGPTVAA